jgi:ATP-dependent helicase HepA
MGLGTIMRVEQRTVSVMFLATGESRNYAVDTAPLTRVRYGPGDRVRSIDGWEMQVSQATELDGLLRYQGVRDDGSQAELAEGLLDCDVRLSRPRDRLLSGQLDHDRWFELRYRTLQQLNRLGHSDIRGLIGPRTSLLPHQLYIAREVAKRYAPRVLLADEVGLGKTIEAGLILHQQLLTERVRRILILVPETLLHQWLVEMLRRFNLRFSLFDEQRCADETDGGYDNPFEAEQLVICDLAFLSNDALRRQQALDSGWDLLVVDEAHHLAWSEDDPSTEYQLVEALAATTPGVLLLTATPEQLGRQSHFARLRLLDPARFSSFDEFLVEEARYRPVAHAVETLLGNEDPDKQTLSLLQATVDEGDNRRLVAVLADGEAGEAARLDARAQLVDHLLDRHGTGRVLFRNTRASVSGFPGREVHLHALPCPPAYAGLDRAGVDITRAQQLLSPEQLHAAASSAGETWHRFDPRIDWLLEKLKALRPAKVLVIAASAGTALDIADVLRIRSGLQAAVFHEGMSIIDRDRAAAFFADREYGTQVLVCSEIGSEGRNFQFAHHLVLFDLPWNPDLLEQRIGRLDRIGQSATINIHVPFLEGTAQERMVRWCHEGLDAFARPCPPAHALFSACRDRLFDLLLPVAGDEQVFAGLLEETARNNARLQSEMQAGRDRLLEFNSCRPQLAETICARVAEQESPSLLLDYAERAFDCYGVEQQEHSDQCLIVKPGAHLQASSIPGLPPDGMTVTLSREIALANEDMQFLSWEHPMIRGLMDMVTSGEQGNCAFTAIRIPKLKPATLFLECLFVLEGNAAESSGLGYYLPTTVMRVVLNTDGRDFGEILGNDVIQRARQQIDKSSGPKVIKRCVPQLRAMIGKAETLADERLPQLIADAQARAHRLLHVEIERLEALKRINPSVRDEEIAYFRQLETRVETMLGGAHMRLDALRVLVTV